jgi:gas vesicle protein
MAENDQGGFVKGFLIGSIMGVLAGMLFAPKAGKELREEIKQRGEEVFGEAKNLYSETRSKASVILEDARRRAEELIKEANRQLAEARQTFPEVIDKWLTAPGHVKFPKGDSLKQVRTRIEKMLAELIAKHPNQTVVLVSHNVVCIAMLCVAIGLGVVGYLFFRHGQGP